MLRKGFTLIELLIVITIIAILAGAAIPYVADYIEQSKVARANVDMSRIRDALTRWELDRKLWDPTDVTAAKLVGPYLQKAAVDPWGQPYAIDSYLSIIYSYGPDQTDQGGIGDDIALAFRPRMSATKVQWIDNTGDGSVNAGDSIVISCTRPVRAADLVAGTTGGLITIGGADTLAVLCTAASSINAVGRKAVFNIDAAVVAGTTVPGAAVVIGTAVGADDLPVDESQDTAGVRTGLTWAINHSLKADDDLILSAE